MDASLKTALQESSVRVFIAIEIATNTGATIRLIDGNGEVSFDVDGTTRTFTSRSTTYGTIQGTGTIEERIAEEAPRFLFAVYPPDAAGIAAWSDIEDQGSNIRVWFGVVNQTTGAVTGDPELLWTGRLDTVKTMMDEGDQAIEVNSISAYERLFIVGEAERLNGVWHQSIWSGETGLDYVYATDETVHWGNKTTTSTGSSGGGYGRGGGNPNTARDLREY